jgi:hypothetical protein
MSSPDSASALPRPHRVYDQALWKAAQNLIADHLCSSDIDRCTNPKCSEGYPCIPARTAARLAAASTAPFHQKMTALFDARSCEVPSPAFFGLTRPLEETGTDPAQAPPQRSAGSPGSGFVPAVSA